MLRAPRIGYVERHSGRGQVLTSIGAAERRAKYGAARQHEPERPMARGAERRAPSASETDEGRQLEMPSTRAAERQISPSAGAYPVKIVAAPEIITAERPIARGTKHQRG